MATTTAQVRDLLLPGLNAVFGDYEQLPTEWSDIFDKHTSKMSAERDVEMKMLGLAQLRTEGASAVYDDMGERFTYSYVHVETGLGFVITKIAIEDNLYKAQFSPGTRQLKNSLAQTKEVMGANVLNFAMDTSGQNNGGDGVPLLSTAHPLDLGLNANTFAIQSELNETSLQDAIVKIGRQRDAAGLLVKIKPKKLIIAPELQFVVDRLLGTSGRVGTSDNDTNAIVAKGLMAGGYSVNHFLTNTRSWYIKNDVTDGLKYFQRRALETDMYVDFDTDNLKTKATERFSFGWSNHRALFGCMP